MDYEVKKVALDMAGIHYISRCLPTDWNFNKQWCFTHNGGFVFSNTFNVPNAILDIEVRIDLHAELLSDAFTVNILKRYTSFDEMYETFEKDKNGDDVLWFDYYKEMYEDLIIDHIYTSLLEYDRR